MKTWNEAWFPCTVGQAYRHACRVDLWPRVLPHYRWVRFHQGGPDSGGLVEMAARRDFGPLGWPIWWLSRMDCDTENAVIRYSHVAGVTKGMEVEWRMTPSGSGTLVTIAHEWSGGPRFCGPAARPVARSLIGPVFVHYVAGETLHYLSLHARRGLTG